VGASTHREQGAGTVHGAAPLSEGAFEHRTMTARIVVVSNRVGDPRKTLAGGLAVAVGDALRRSGGLWFGWSGEVVDTVADAAGRPLHLQRAGRAQLATLDLTTEERDRYYFGFSNQALWPALHYRLDLADFSLGAVEVYRRVNRLFAQRLMPLLRPDDLIWVHDYHLIPLASELRALGCRQRIGFFLHIPLPPPPIVVAIPGHDWLMRSLFDYDLIGLQTRTDALHFARYVQDEVGGRALADDCFAWDGRTVRACAFPIGIDVDEFRQLAHCGEAVEALQHLRKQYAERRLLVGIDRLDYTKGLPQRLRAFEDLLHRYPEQRMSATLIQIAAPSRETVIAYEDIRRELESLSGRINGEYGETDWMPVRYMHRSWSRRRLPGLYRSARVALVTPLRDGMNLVAKEYVAVQDEDDPGVLVLSRFAGAAEALDAALLVNPYDIHTTADAMSRALAMPLDERRERHAALMRSIRRDDVFAWRNAFLKALVREHVPDGAGAAEPQRHAHAA
jgi:trehalose 6-phosphate synthase